MAVAVVSFSYKIKKKICAEIKRLLNGCLAIFSVLAQYVPVCYATQSEYGRIPEIPSSALVCYCVANIF